MGFFSKIFSFFKRDISDPSDSQKSSKVFDASIDTTSAPKEGFAEVDNRDGNSKDVANKPILLPETKFINSNPEDSSDSDNKDATPNSISPDSLQQFPLEEKEESYIDRIRREEEERKKRERLEFLRTKRAKRRKELEEELVVIDKQLTFIQERILAIKEEKKGIVKKDAPDILLNPSFATPQPANQFNIKEFERIITMRELLQQRIEEERKRIEEAERTALVNIQEAKEAIKNRNIDRARECLDILSKQTSFIENKDINAAIKDVVFAITELSNQLEAEKRAREEQRRKQEALAAQQRAEALERQRQEEAARKLREEEEKKERARKYEEELREKEKAQQEEISRLNGLYLSLKPDASEIVKFLRDNGIYYLYHFTEASNIPLIKSRKGLYSWSYLLSHGMKIPSPGGNDTGRGLDRDKGLEDYVRLSLCKSHPMAYRLYQESEGRANLVLLKIKIDVAMFESTLFSDGNATDKRAQIGSDKGFLDEHIDVDAISLDWCWGSDPRFKKRQAEVMVKTFIPLKYIVNLDNPEKMTFNN